MFAVIFEVQPKAARWDDYLNLAKYLKPKLETTDGFIGNERFASKRTKGRVLSLSTWRDEKAVVRWRTQGEHRAVQEKGRVEIFEDYRLRVGEVTNDSNPPQGLAVEQQRFDETANAAAKAVSISEWTPPEKTLIGRISRPSGCRRCSASTSTPMGSWTTRYSRASTCLADFYCSPHGAMPKLQADGAPFGHRRLGQCVTGGCGSSATTA